MIKQENLLIVFQCETQTVLYFDFIVKSSNTKLFEWKRNVVRLCH